MPAPEPVCPGGGRGLWRCGGLIFDEATYGALARDYPGRCTALSTEVLLCGAVLLFPEAQAALGSRACSLTCERPQLCAPVPLPAALGAPLAQPAFLTFAQETLGGQPPQPAATPFRCPDGSSFMVTPLMSSASEPPQWFCIIWTVMCSHHARECYSC